MTFAYLCTTDSFEITQLSPELIGYGWFRPDALPSVNPYIREAVTVALARAISAHRDAASPMR